MVTATEHLVMSSVCSFYSNYRSYEPRPLNYGVMFVEGGDLALTSVSKHHGHAPLATPGPINTHKCDEIFLENVSRDACHFNPHTLHSFGYSYLSKLD